MDFAPYPDDVMDATLAPLSERVTAIMRENLVSLRCFSQVLNILMNLFTRPQAKTAEEESSQPKGLLPIALAVPSNLCDFNGVEITTPCKFQQQGIYFPTLNPLYC